MLKLLGDWFVRAGLFEAGLIGWQVLLIDLYRQGFIDVCCRAHGFRLV